MANWQEEKPKDIKANFKKKPQFNSLFNIKSTQL
jgi:hypothetical protein